MSIAQLEADLGAMGRPLPRLTVGGSTCLLSRIGTLDQTDLWVRRWSDWVWGLIKQKFPFSGL